MIFKGKNKKVQYLTASLKIPNGNAVSSKTANWLADMNTESLFLPNSSYKIWYFGQTVIRHLFSIKHIVTLVLILSIYVLLMT